MTYSSAVMRKIASQIKANKKIQYEMQKEVRDDPVKPQVFPIVASVNIDIKLNTGIDEKL
jgi:hypothetical protein